MEARPLLGHVCRVRGNGWDQRGNDIQVPGCAEVSAWNWGRYCVSSFILSPWFFFHFLSFFCLFWLEVGFGDQGDRCYEGRRTQLMNAQMQLPRRPLRSRLKRLFLAHEPQGRSWRDRHRRFEGLSLYHLKAKQRPVYFTNLCVGYSASYRPSPYSHQLLGVG